MFFASPNKTFFAGQVLVFHKVLAEFPKWQQQMYGLLHSSPHIWLRNSFVLLFEVLNELVPVFMFEITMEESIRPLASGALLSNNKCFHSCNLIDLI